MFVTVQNRMSEYNSTQTESFNQQIVQSKANELGAWLYSRVCELRMLSQYDGVNLTAKEDSYVGYESAEQAKEEAMNELVSRLNLQLKDLYGNTEQTFLIVNSNGVGWTKDHIRIDVSEREYFIEAVAADETREYTVSKPVISKIDGIRTVFLCYPIRNQQGEKQAYLIGAIAAEKLDTIVSAINIFDGSAWIMDRHGIVISKANNQTEEDPLDPTNLSLTKTASVLQSANYGIEPFQTDKIDGELIYSSIPYTDGWKLCVLAENDVIYAGNREVSRSIFYVWVGLLLSSFLLCIIFTTNIIKPIKRLQKAMAEVENGNFHAAGNYLSPHPIVASKDSEVMENEIRAKGDEIRELGFSFQSMVLRIEELMDHVVKEQKAKRKAELRALQAQINPHFLYNTLDTLQWKALEYNAMEVAEIVNALSGFFRFSLNKGKELITWNEEVEHAYYYLFIQQIRYRDKLDFDIELEQEIENQSVVKIILQPLIENAIYHGIKPSSKPGKIQVKINPSLQGGASRRNLALQDKHVSQWIEVVVSDNGVGMPKERLTSLQQSLGDVNAGIGYGVRNVHERLQLTYGDDYSMEIESEEGQGTTVRIYLPCTEEAKHF